MTIPPLVVCFLAVSLLGGPVLVSPGGVAAQSRAPRVEQGSLTSSDDTLETGEYVDSYTFRGDVGQRVLIELTASDFDGYLVLIPPKGEQIENDDAFGDDDRSVIETDLDQRGTYRVLVTSYEPGEVGRYHLRIAIGPGGGSGATSRPASIGFGQTRNGRLDASDVLEDDSYRDAYVFDGQVGDSVRIDLTSPEFDTYLTLVAPDGTEIDNDDADGDQDVSRIEVVLTARGRYRIVVTSYDERETGAYTLALHRAAAATTSRTPPRSASPSRGARARVAGIFVGISDYPGEGDDLEYTANDARRIRQELIRGAGMQAEDATLLVDRGATTGAFRRAIADAAVRTAPEDLVVIFFSGHGDRLTRQMPQPADPDGLDETLTFHDGSITDDEMSRLLDGIKGRVLLVLDSCFSGGFSKDVISSPRRMGLFSSEEDVTSSVADKFRAGGYLAKFMAEAVGDWKADRDGNGDITAIELSQYVHERYRSDVKSSNRNDNYVRTSGPASGYQHLVVDRGSIGPFDVLLRR